MVKHWYSLGLVGLMAYAVPACEWRHHGGGIRPVEEVSTSRPSESPPRLEVLAEFSFDKLTITATAFTDCRMIRTETPINDVTRGAVLNSRAEPAEAPEAPTHEVCSNKPAGGLAPTVTTAVGVIALSKLDPSGRGEYAPSVIRGDELRRALALTTDRSAVVEVAGAKQTVDVTPWVDAMISEQFDRAEALKTAEAYEDFIRLFPHSGLAFIARSRLAELARPAQLLAAENELNSIKAKATPEELISLSRRYPDTASGDAALALAENKLWARVRSGKMEDYQKYLDLFPNAERSDAVRAKVQAVEDRRARAEFAAMVRQLPGLVQRCAALGAQRLSIVRSMQAALQAGSSAAVELYEDRFNTNGSQICEAQGKILDVVDALESADQTLAARAAEYSARSCMVWDCD